MLNNNLNFINFKQLEQAFAHMEVKLSYLTASEVNKVLNFPLKENHPFDFSMEDLQNNNGICLILLENDQKAYGFQTIYQIIENFPFLHCHEVYCLHKKLAVVMAGMGQWGKNQLVYCEDYGFNTTIRTFIIYNPVINLPKRNAANFSLLSLCENCNECIKNCPAHAIHGNDTPMWLDRFACNNFYGFGDSDKVPTLKYGINLFLNNKLTKEELLQVKDPESFKKFFGFEYKEFVVELDGMRYALRTDTCSECTNQIPCRKFERIYDKNFVRLDFIEKLD